MTRTACDLIHDAKDGEMFACAAPRAFPVAALRQDFPALHQTINNHPLVYLDSAASAQKPRAVLEAMQRFYERDYANIHRGVHTLSARATDRYEGVRETVRRFINAAHTDEIVFTRGATDAINIVAASLGQGFLKAGDEIIVTQLEHHANIVPWQFLRDQRGLVLKVAPLTSDGAVRVEDITALITPRTRLIACAHVSNALGTVLPVKEIVALAHTHNALALIDGAQGICHAPVNVRDLDADFYVFSGHKLYGPTGIGVLYGKKDLLNSLPPVQGGGDMIASVSFEQSFFKDAPYRFEAGTPPIAEVIGLGAAIDYLGTIGMERIAQHEATILAYATAQLAPIAGLKIIGTAPHKAGLVSFIVDRVHPHDLGTILDDGGVAIRAGHHCAQPVMTCYGIAATARASFGLYTTTDDIDALVRGVKKAQDLFA